MSHTGKRSDSRAAEFVRSKALMNLVHSQAQGQHLDEQSRGWKTCSHHHPLHRWDTEAHTGHPSAPYPARFNINPTPHTHTTSPAYVPTASNTISPTDPSTTATLPPHSHKLPTIAKGVHNTTHSQRFCYITRFPRLPRHLRT